MPISGHFSGNARSEARSETYSHWAPPTDIQGAQPKLLIEIQPVGSFRFRYKSEKPVSHGNLYGEKNGTEKKAFPTVKVLNYKGNVTIKASLVTNDDNLEPHVHKLIDPDYHVNGICQKKIENTPEMKAVFQNLYIEHQGKKEVPEIILSHLIKCKELQTNQSDFSPAVRKQLREQAEKKAKKFDLNVVRIRFDAIIDDSNIPIEPVFSSPIRNLKSAKSGELKICRMDKTFGVCSGQEEVFLLCEKVKKDDIQVIFFEDDENGERIWSDTGRFDDHDVHRQYAIVFKTPPYRDENLSTPVSVSVMLHRPSDDMCSKPHLFTYKPKDDDHIGTQRKRLRPNPSGFEDQNQPNTYSQFGSAPLPRGNCTHQTFNIENVNSNYQPSFQNDTNSHIRANSIDPLLSSSSDLDYLSQCSPSSASLSPFSDQLFGLETDGRNKSTGVIKHENNPSTPQANKNHKPMLGGRTAQNSDKSTQEIIIQYKLLNQFAKTGDISKLMKSFEKIIGMEDQNGDNAVMQAIIHRNFLGAKIMIENAYDFEDGRVINHQNHLRQTALHLAVHVENVEIVLALLIKKCKIEKIDRYSNSVFHLAANINSKKCLSNLCKFAKSNQILHRVLNLKNDNGMTPLHLAVTSGHNDCIDLLLSYGADVNFAAGKCGKRPLHMAVENSDLTVVKMLLAKEEVDVNLQTFNGDTALHYAVTEADKNKEIVLELLKHGADPLRYNFDVQDNDEGICSADLIGGIAQLTKYMKDEQSSVLQNFNNLSIKEENKLEKADITPVLHSTSHKKHNICEDEGYVSKELKNALDQVTIQKLAEILDPPNVQWETLASFLDFEDKVNQLRKAESPTKALLQLFYKKGKLIKLYYAFEAMDLKSAMLIVDEVIQRCNEHMV